VLARRAAAGVRTVGVAASGVDIPYREPARVFADSTIELGLGIHGEPGRQRLALGSARGVVDRIAGELLARLPAGAPVAVLVNNLGGVSSLEMDIVAESLLSGALGQRVELIIGPAPLMTSLGMKGFSISALPLDEEIRSALSAPSDPAAAWPGAYPVSSVTVAPVPDDPSVRAFAPSSNPDLYASIAGACEALHRARTHLDALDAKIGDGDTGSTFASAASRIAGELDALPLAAPADLCARLSQLTSSSMGASSGVLLSILFATMSTSLAAGATVGTAMADGVSAMQRYGGAAHGDRTMLDALIPAAEILQAGGTFVDAATAARKGAESTATLSTAKAGRASYVASEHLAGVADPGATAIAVVFEALAA
jgi:dihydroxyacetone kinase